jgi:hypothetical protein
MRHRRATLLVAILTVVSGCRDWGRKVFQTSAVGPITVEFFTELHDDPGIPVRAKVHIKDSITYETAHLETFDKAGGNKYALTIHEDLKLATICNVKRPLHVLHVVDLVKGGHCDTVYGQHYQGDAYWAQVKANIKALHRKNPSLSFECYSNWRELVAEDPPEAQSNRDMDR